MKSLNQISFIDSSGNEIKLNANNTKEAAFDKVVGTVPLRDASGRFRIGNTGVSSTDGYVAVNKNYVDGRINALDKSDSAVAGQFVSAVSETNGIISVSRRAIVDSDGVVLKTGNQTNIQGDKTFTGNISAKNGVFERVDANYTIFAKNENAPVSTGNESQCGVMDKNNHYLYLFTQVDNVQATNNRRGLYDSKAGEIIRVDNSTDEVRIKADVIQCSTAPSSSTDVVRKYDVSRINVYYRWASLLPSTGDEVTWSRLTSFLSNNNWAVARVAKYDNSTLSYVWCSCQMGYTSYSSGLINSVTIEIPADFASYFGNKTKETFNRNGAAGTTVIQSQLLPYLMVQNLEYYNPF